MHHFSNCFSRKLLLSSKHIFGDSTPYGCIKKKAPTIINHRCLVMVGKTRLELATTRPPDVYANQLRYFPEIALGTLVPWNRAQRYAFFSTKQECTSFFRRKTYRNVFFKQKAKRLLYSMRLFDWTTDKTHKRRTVKTAKQPHTNSSHRFT